MNRFILSTLGAALLAAAPAQAAESPYYNPSNPASASGMTSGYELYKTIGCPGRGILEAPCAAPVAAKPAPKPMAPAKVADKPAEAPRDSDGDGVVDTLDRCTTTPAGRKVNAQGCELDSDGDGVLDAADACPGTPAATAVDDKGCALPKIVSLEGVNFDNDEDLLRSDSLAILEAATATLKRNPSVKVEVAGHTDGRGTSEHNLDLSSRRAKAVMDYFIGHGVAADRLSAKGYGEAQPIANNYLEEGRMKNRRVELRIVD
jgi:OOP family OmpA-OmpF porin